MADPPTATVWDASPSTEDPSLCFTVEGGHVGDARIDRFIELGVNDVWTVDLPGGDDADLIRHQIIHISEYRNAISVSGYRVNKKYL